MKLSSKLALLASTSAASAYGHGLLAAYLETSGAKHYAEWAGGASCASAFLAAVAALFAAIAAVEAGK